MALLYESDQKTEDGEKHQLARRYDGQWFSRWVWNEKFTPWIDVKNPILNHDTVVTDTMGPDEILTKGFGVHRIKRYAKLDLPKA